MPRSDEPGRTRIRSWGSNLLGAKNTAPGNQAGKRAPRQVRVLRAHHGVRTWMTVQLGFHFREPSTGAIHIASYRGRPAIIFSSAFAVHAVAGTAQVSPARGQSDLHLMRTLRAFSRIHVQADADD